MNYKKERNRLTGSFGKKVKAMKLIGSLIAMVCILAILLVPAFGQWAIFVPYGSKMTIGPRGTYHHFGNMTIGPGGTQHRFRNMTITTRGTYHNFD